MAETHPALETQESYTKFRSWKAKSSLKDLVKDDPDDLSFHGNRWMNKHLNRTSTFMKGADTEWNFSKNLMLTKDDSQYFKLSTPQEPKTPMQDPVGSPSLRQSTINTRTFMPLYSSSNLNSPLASSQQSFLPQSVRKMKALWSISGNFEEGSDSSDGFSD